MPSGYAKEHSLDIPHINCIEFPLKVNNLDKALDLCGGEKRIINSLHDENTNPLELRFTSNVHEHPITAKVSNHEQVLIKISVPKKLLDSNNGNIQKTLQDIHEKNKKPIHVAPIAIINKSFRFREMSDFQYQTSSSKFSNQVDKAIHELKYDQITSLDVFTQDLKPWEYDLQEEELFDLPPPPRFSSIPLPFNFNYKKNSATITKEGKITTRNKHIKLHSIIIKWTDQPPKGPSSELLTQLKIFRLQQKDNAFFKDILETISRIQHLFSVKPIWIRKHLEAILPVSLKPCLKYALPQVAYTYTKGPWRQAYVKFGIDPKTSPEYSIYQTEGFRVPKFNKVIPKTFVSENPTGVSKIFKFTGEEVPVSLLFKLEDIIDPVIANLLKNDVLKDTVDFESGWFTTLTMLKLRRLMRYKLRKLVEGSAIDPDKIDYIVNKLQLNEETIVDNVEEEDDDNEDEEDDEELENDYELDINDSNYQEILDYLKKFNPQGAEELGKLSGVLKQANIDLD